MAPGESPSSDVGSVNKWKTAAPVAHKFRRRASVANVMLMAGAGEAIAMIGSAIVTKVVIDAGKVAIQKAASK
ncbi:DUF2523 domain-containing protein [Stenotrophomonas indicatrix]|uniref:DUF2523 domain-containing protein n=1 Tax=Stenotrophomonas indicatrix TaxID=2045451 RepID=UPI002165A276|nr:DUF2523 domain-containing protein [Stenotrophomonas indicatrix]